MATLAKHNDKITILKVDINEPDSPVARQYKIETMPFFKVYDGRGRLVVEGQPAVDWLDGEMDKVNLKIKKDKGR